MGVIRNGQTLHLQGDCRVEDAETLVVMLQTDSTLGLDLSECQGLHTAVLQAIIAFRPTVHVAPPADSFIGRHLAPLLSPAGQGAAASL